MNDDDRLVAVYSTDDPAEAEILCSALREEGIPCELEGGRQGGLAGLSIMQIKLLVRAGDFDRAREYLEETEGAGEEDEER